MARNRIANLDSLPEREAEFVEPMECDLVSKLARLMTLFGAAAARMLVRLHKLSRDLIRMDDKKRNVLLAMAQKVSQPNRRKR
jgi:hypothetical protein